MRVELPISEGSTGFPPGGGPQTTVGPAGELKSIGPQSLVGDYLILERLSRGGMGVVYKAKHQTLGRVVALKTILTGHLASDEEVKRFRTEAEAAASLEHPNIVPIYETGEHEGQPYFTMRLIEGGNLASWSAEHLRNGSSQTLQSGRDEGWIRRSAGLIATVANAVHHAHQRGILHRDLKPSNILIDREGKPYVTDFGLARLLKKDSDLTLSGATVGTPNYMAPEQAQGKNKQLTTAADVFSLGAILYEMLTGVAPFNAETPLETVKRVVEAEPSRPSTVNLAVDRDLETICLKCLEKDPTRRYEFAKDFADDLERWQNHEPISARPATAPERVRKWIRRRPVLAALSGFLVLSLVGFGSTVAINQVRLERERDQTQAQLANSLMREGEAYAANNRPREAKQKVNESRALSEKTKLSTLPADLALLDIYRRSPPPLLTLTGHQGGVLCVTVSLDKRNIFSGGADGTIRRWSLPTGRQESVWPAHPGGVSALAKSPDGKLLISGGVDGGIKVWDSSKNDLLANLTGHSNQVAAIAFTTNGQTFASASRDGLICVWRTETMQAIKTLKTDLEDVTGITFTTNSLQIMAASADDSGATLWNLDGMAKSNAFPSAGTCLSLATSPGGETVFISNSDGLITRRDQGGNVIARPYIQLRSPSTALAVSYVRARVVAGSADGGISTWDIAQDQPIPEVVLSDHQGAVTSIALFDGDRRAASASEDGTIRVWDTFPQQGVVLLREHSGEVTGTAFSPDGLVVLSADAGGYLKLWDAASGKLLLKYTGHQGAVLGCAFSPDGQLASSAGVDGTCRIWDVANGQELHRYGGNGNAPATAGPHLSCVAFSRDGKLLFAGEKPGQSMELGPKEWSLHVLDAATGRERTNLPAHRGGVLSVAISPDGGRVVTGGADGRMIFWDPRTWQRVGTVTADPQRVNAVVFTKDGQRCLSAGALGPPRVWETAGGRELGSLAGLADEVVSMAVSADSSLLLAGMSRGEMKIWDLDTGGELHTFPRFDFHDTRSVSFAPQGRRAFASIGPISLWDFDRVTELRRHEPAVRGASAALQLNPTDRMALKTLAEWYEFRGAWDWAGKLFRQARELGAAVPHLALARCLWQHNDLNDLKAAQAEMSQAATGQEAPHYYLECCQSAIAREIQNVPVRNTNLIVSAGAMVVPAVSGKGKDIWTTSIMALAPMTERPGGGLANENLVVGGWGDDYWSLLQFDLNGLPSNATSATLCLFCYQTIGQDTAMYLERITEEWDWRDRDTGPDRDRLWWDGKPRSERWESDALAPPAQGHWYKLDITALYNAWQGGAHTNYGLLLRPRNTTNQVFNRFYSSRYTNDPNLRPQLMIVPAAAGPRE